MFGQENQRAAMCGVHQRRPDADHAERDQHAEQGRRVPWRRARSCSSPSVFSTSQPAPSRP